MKVLHVGDENGAIVKENENKIALERSFTTDYQVNLIKESLKMQVF